MASGPAPTFIPIVRWRVAPFFPIATVEPSTESRATSVEPFVTRMTKYPYGAPAALGRIGSKEKLLVIVYVNPPLTIVAARRSVGIATPVESVMVKAGLGTVVPLATAHGGHTWPRVRLIGAGAARLSAKTGWPPEVDTVSSPVLGSSSETAKRVLSPGINQV